MIKLQDYIYQLEHSDLEYDDNGSYILIEDYLNISLLINNIPGTTNLINFHGFNNNKNIIIDYLNIQGLNDDIIFNEELNLPSSSSSSDLETYHINNNINPNAYKIYQILYDSNSYFINPESNQNYGYKKIYIPLLPPDININDYKLVVNNLNNKINVDLYKNLSELFNQNINLYTSKIESKEQNLQQNVDILNEQEQNIEEIRIANYEVYIKNKDVPPPPIIYLPFSNIKQQNILVQYNNIKFQTHPPLAFHLQILNEDNKIIFQLKKSLETLQDYEYGMYGYKYGVLKDSNDINNQQILATIYGNELTSSNIYTIVWQLDQNQINTIKTNNNRNNSNVKFRIRYSNNKDNNDNFIWKGWSQEIENIIINTIPEKPSQIKMNTK